MKKPSKWVVAFVDAIKLSNLREQFKNERKVMSENELQASMEKPKYVCHKEVHALEIDQIVRLRCGTGIIHPVDKSYAPFEVSADYMKKHNPQDNGYYVVYKGGYASWSPKEAFENGYNTCD